MVVSRNLLTTLSLLHPTPAAQRVLSPRITLHPTPPEPPLSTTHTHLHATAAATLAVLLPSPAHAAGLDALPSALAAYGHYLALLVGSGALVAERLLLKPDMSADDVEKLTAADVIWGVSGAVVAFTGYLRTRYFAKGWEFYSHEPIFWLKLTLLAVMGAASLFPTISIIKAAAAAKDSGGTPQYSDKLVSRMTSVINAELLALFSIPLAATTMSRGIGYVDWFPWQAGAVPVVVALGGLGYKYTREALDWED